MNSTVNIPVTCLQYTDGRYGIIFCDIHKQVNAFMNYNKEKVIYITESELIHLAKAPLEEVEERSKKSLEN